jgi:glyoxylase-like metal-dependent hydrolase (beta-lactamase superfamily II)
MVSSPPVRRPTMILREDGDLAVIKFEDLGAFGNNAYIVADASRKEAVIIDMPSESAKVLSEVERRGLVVKTILLTHSHPDHWADYGLVKEATSAPVRAHEAERGVLGHRIDEPVEDGAELEVGRHTIKAIHTPGHTPGSTCYLVGSSVFSGDTLFPGGPGRTNTPAALRETIQSITRRLFALPDDTEVLPGHGDDTTIARSKAEYAVFASRDHDPALCGDVLWETA